MGQPATSGAIPELRWQEQFARRSARGGDELTAILSLATSRDIITFSGGFPAPETFPVEVIRELADELLSKDAALALQYSPTEGLPDARAAVSQLIEQEQGRPIGADDVLITSGGIEALQLLARTFVDPGDRVLVESPSYLGAIMAFAGFEADVEGVLVDEDGLRLDELERALASGPPPKLLYVIPDYQNPTGLSLSAARRVELVEICRRAGVLIVEDVAYRQLSFDGSTVTSLWSLAPDVVVQIGTFSKVFMPGVRLGWAVGPGSIIGAMAAAKQNSDQCSGALGQMLMARFVERGHLQRNLVGARALYEGRANAMNRALGEYMPAGVEWTKPRGGFFTWLTAAPDVDARALAAPAARLGVAYVPGAPFYTDSGDGGSCFRLSFSRAAEDQIDEGIRRLASLLQPGSSS
ncbi:MAG TPA: PLP-dependent aminotransferase family protein [Jatrophihabitans sp.]|nr:PLP-dependent aminotransferase family protein [Jatrophihabitans sp.]